MLTQLKLDKETRNRCKLDDFEIIHLNRKKKGALGVGSFATVKLAKHKKSGKYFALKIVSNNFHNSLR